MATYNAVISEGFTYTDVIKPFGYDLLVQEGYLFNDNLITSNKFNLSLSDIFSVNDTTQLSRIIGIVIEDNLGFSGNTTTNANYFEKVVENPNFNAFLTTYKEVNGNLELDDSYDCWCVNYENNAFSRFSNYNFNSFCKLGNDYYASNELGIFKLGTDTDNNKDIKSKILTGKIDLSGMGSLSYARDITLHQKSDGTLRLNITANDGKSESYRMLNPSDDIVASRINLSKGRKAIYWQFELTNDANTDFELETVKIYRVITARIS